MMIERLINMPIMSLQTGAQVATVAGVIIDPRQLAIAALYVDNPIASRDTIVLHPSDIREISDIGIIIDNDSKLMPLEGLIRLQQIIDFDFELQGLGVVDEQKHKHGKVKNFAIDPRTFTIEQIYVSKPIFQSINSVGQAIHRSQIVSINNERLVIKSATIKDNVTRTRISPNFVNPFRKTEQPEG